MAKKPVETLSLAQDLVAGLVRNTDPDDRIEMIEAAINTLPTKDMSRIFLCGNVIALLLDRIDQMRADR